MNYYDIVNKIARGEKLDSLPLRVTYYTRVSTSSDVQLISLDNQLSYYENYIKSNKNWEYVNGYTDEGISGTQATKRPAFMKMIEAAKSGKFDMIITKDVSRFARDIEDSVHYTRKLKEFGVGVLFENQSLNTFDPNTELTLNILYNLSQEESKKISTSVKFGYRKSISNGHVLGSSNITGYRKDNCKLVIVPEEAKMIKRLFELYSTGEYGFHKLAIKLYNEGYTNKKGRIYDKDSLKRMIQNPKYKGYYRARTYETLDYRTKKRKKIEKENQIIYKSVDNRVPAIVSEELWDRANEILDIRTKGYQNNNYWSGGVKYPFSSKIYCMEHNTSFQRSHGRRKSNRPTWSCGLYLQYRLDACASPIIAEADLYNIFLRIMNNIMPEKDKIINSMLKLYENIDKTNQYDCELNEIEEQLQMVEGKKNMALDLVYHGELRREELTAQFAGFEKEIKMLNMKRERVLEQINILNQSRGNVEKITQSIKEEIEGGSIEEFIRKFVDEIIVSKIDNDRNNIRLDIYLNLIGSELPKIKGARHIEGITSNDIPYVLNQKCSSIETLREGRKTNEFTYNVYIESL